MNRIKEVLDQKGISQTWLSRQIGNPRQYEHLANATQSQASTQFTQQQQSHPSQETQPTYHHSAISELISGSLGLFDLPTDKSDDTEEDIFRRRMQRKKKRGALSF